MKESIGNQYIRTVKVSCKSNLNAGNFISGMNTWGYRCDEVQWKNYRLEKRGTSGHGPEKIMNCCFHPRNSVARLYMKWKEGGRGLISVDECITTERRGLYDYLKESKEDILTEALKENVIEEGETKEEVIKRKRDERKKTLHNGKLQGQFEKTRNIKHCA